jgi:Uma2 family endonuclease
MRCIPVAARASPDFITVAEFLVWDAPAGSKWQLSNGVPEAMAPASGTHAVIQNEAGALLRVYLNEHRPGCRPLGAPDVVPEVGSQQNFRIPDIRVTRAYGTIPSVREILVIGTASIGVQLLRRAADGSWPEVPLAIEVGALGPGEHRVPRSGCRAVFRHLVGRRDMIHPRRQLGC